MLAAAVLILSAFLILLFLPIPFGHIELRGAKNVTMENVLFEGNIDEPINTLQISASDVTKRLENDLRIEEVNIERKFPATIVINIIERKPTAIIQTEYGYAVIDKRGIVIRTESALTDGDYPMITGKKLDNILLGDKIEEPDVLNALEFINHLSEKGAKEFSEINIGNQKNLMAYTRNGISVRLGAAGDLGKQATLAENMVNDVEARGLSVEYLDANMANPFIKLKK